MAALVDELLVILHGLWLRRWLALGVAWGVCLAGWLGVALIPNSYESKARVYVNTQSLLEDKVGITQVQAQQDLDRSEEHTSELQSLMRISYAVFCLKKKTQQIITINSTHHTSNPL